MAESFTLKAPFDGRELATYPLQSEEQVQEAVDLAVETFENRDAWLSKLERIEILQRATCILGDRKEELARQSAEEGGKPLPDSLVEAHRAMEGMQVAVDTLKAEAGHGVPMGVSPASSNRLSITMHEPLGVVSSISAFNHPINLIVHQVVPAIAVGCPVLIKPSLMTPRSCINVVEILREAGLPEAWCQVILCDHEDAGPLSTDPRLAFLSFIGSAKVGWFLRSQLPPGAKCCLEHGGAAPVIFCEDAPIDLHLEGIVKGGMYHAGQVCVSVQRVFAHESVVQELAEKVTARCQSLRVGDPLLSDTEVGPLIRPEEVERIHEWVQEAIQGGAKLLCGGEPLSETCYAPTVLFDPPAEAKVSKEEIFGPVICIYPFQDRREAIQRANGVPFCFQASVYTHNLDVAFDSVQRLNATTVMVNDHSAFRVDWMPFGGAKSSGLGFGGIPQSMEDMTLPKQVIFKSPSL